MEDEDPVLFQMGARQPGRGRPIAAVRVVVPDRQDLLPAEITSFTRRGVYDDAHTHLSFLQGGGHGGSHPHLVHEFVMRDIQDIRLASYAPGSWSCGGTLAAASEVVTAPIIALTLVGHRASSGAL